VATGIIAAVASPIGKLFAKAAQSASAKPKGVSPKTRRRQKEPA